MLRFHYFLSIGGVSNGAERGEILSFFFGVCRREKCLKFNGVYSKLFEVFFFSLSLSVERSRISEIYLLEIRKFANLLELEILIFFDENFLSVLVVFRSGVC